MEQRGKSGNKEKNKGKWGLYFDFHWNSQFHVYESQGQSNLAPLYHCAETSLTLKGVKLCSVDPAFNVWLPICATKPVAIFLETGSTEKSLSTKTDFVHMLLSSEAQCSSGVPTRYRAARFIGMRFTHSLG